MDLSWMLPKATVLLGGMLSGFGSNLGFDISKPASALQAIAILAVIIAVHEAGHFAAARLQGIRVTRFAVGFGPTVFKYQGPEVEYVLCAIPLGGYVAFPDDDPTNAAFDPNDPNLLKNRPLGQRAAVISAGVAANIVFAWLLLLTQITTVGKAETAFLPGVRVGPEVAAVTAAGRGGLRPGDVITAIGETAIPAGPEQVSTSVAAIRAAAGKQVTFEVLREGSGAQASSSASQRLRLPVTPDAGQDGRGRIGVQLSSNTFIRHTYAGGPAEALAMTQSEFNRLFGTVWGGLVKIATNFSAMSGQLSGPVAIVAQGSEVLRADAAGLFQFGAIISINLAAVNALPLPALDGGYMALLALEALRGGRKLPDGLEAGLSGAGFLLLTGLGLTLLVRDTVNLL